MTYLTRLHHCRLISYRRALYAARAGRKAGAGHTDTTKALAAVLVARQAVLSTRSR